MTPRDRVRFSPGRKETAGDVGHRQGFLTPSGDKRTRPGRRQRVAFGRRCPLSSPWLAMSRIAAPGGRGGAPRIYIPGGTPPVAPRGAPSRKPREAVSRGHYHRSLVSSVNLVLAAVPLETARRSHRIRQGIHRGIHWGIHRGAPRLSLRRPPRPLCLLPGAADRAEFGTKGRRA